MTDDRERRLARRFDARQAHIENYGNLRLKEIASMTVDFNAGYAAGYAAGRDSVDSDEEAS